MKERPILFSAPMVRAILDGSKTQTRRVVKLPHSNPLGQWEPTIIGGENGGRTAAGDTLPLQGGIWHTRTGDSLMCPYGQPGDRLYVRETWRTTGDCGRADYLAPKALQPHQVWYDADGSAPDDQCVGKTRVSIHMPRWASRILLEIVSVRAERLLDISQVDAMAEGVWTGKTACKDYITLSTIGCQLNHIGAFYCLWEDINGYESLQSNPWVWVVEFKRVQP